MPDVTRRDEDASAEARTLDRIVAHAQRSKASGHATSSEGDWVVVRTRNSIYSLASRRRRPLSRRRRLVRGRQCENVRVRVVGCTWGGTAIHTGLVAAPGMFLEFDNGVRTTRIREVRLMRAGETRH